MQFRRARPVWSVRRQLLSSGWTKRGRMARPQWSRARLASILQEGLCRGSATRETQQARYVAGTFHPCMGGEIGPTQAQDWKLTKRDWPIQPSLNRGRGDAARLSRFVPPLGFLLARRSLPKAGAHRGQDHYTCLGCKTDYEFGYSNKLNDCSAHPVADGYSGARRLIERLSPIGDIDFC